MTCKKTTLWIKYAMNSALAAANTRLRHRIQNIFSQLTFNIIILKQQIKNYGL